MIFNDYNYIYLAIAFTSSLIFSLIATPFVISICKRHNLFDMPDERKVHKFAIPRFGGSLFFPSMCLGTIISQAVLTGGFSHDYMVRLSSIAMGVGALMIYLIGLLDDLKGMKAMHKFIIQSISALLFPLCNLMINDLHGLFGIHELPIVIAYPLTVFVILLIVNAMNLIDGIDGLAASLSIIMLATFSYLFQELNSVVFSTLSISLAGALLAFFIFNFFGKIGGMKIFMGDSGSLFIGYVISYFAIKYQMSNWDVFEYRENSFLISFTIVMLPCLDVIRVALCRKLNGKRMFDPDKTHIHHLIMATGLNMHQTLATILTIYILFAIINYALFVLGTNITIIILTDISLYSCIIWKAIKSEKKL